MFNTQQRFNGLHEIFEFWALYTPNAIALMYEAEYLSYENLNARANQIAHQLLKQGVSSGDLVGIYLDRGSDLIAAILAVLKTGAAYLPFDKAQPNARIEYILEDAKPKITITDQEEFASKQILNLKNSKTESENKSNLGLSGSADHLSYIIYTSGTTGKPKGVCVTHGNVMNLLQASREVYDFSEKDTWSLFHSYAFDFSVWEIWGALAFGAKLAIVPQKICLSAKDFYEFLKTNKVTVLNQTPGMLTQLINIFLANKTDGVLNLRYVILGGEVLHVHSLKEWFDTFDDNTPQIFNMYGITETTVHVTYHKISKADLKSDRSIIGKPLKNYQIVLLDSNLQEVPIGQKGEICVSGYGVAKGYLNNAELSAKKFIKIENTTEQLITLYRSGDLGVINAQGQLEYLGRIDNQIKLRGYRIELEEIEYLLNKQTQVKNSAVILKGTNVKNQSLVAFIQLTDGSMAMTSQELRQSLKNFLPDYMVPANFHFVTDMPMTPNNKIDRKLLLNNISN